MGIFHENSDLFFFIDITDFRTFLFEKVKAELWATEKGALVTRKQWLPFSMALIVYRPPRVKK